jgi:hypothetical protein
VQANCKTAAGWRLKLPVSMDDMHRSTVAEMRPVAEILVWWVRRRVLAGYIYPSRMYSTYIGCVRSTLRRNPNALGKAGGPLFAWNPSTPAVRFNFPLQSSAQKRFPTRTATDKSRLPIFPLCFFFLFRPACHPVQQHTNLHLVSLRCFLYHPPPLRFRVPLLPVIAVVHCVLRGFVTTSSAPSRVSSRDPASRTEARPRHRRTLQLLNRAR